MPRPTKDESVDIIRENVKDDAEYLIQCMFNYYSDIQLEEFAEWIINEF